MTTPPAPAALIWQIFWVALLTDLATGLGALPFVFVRTLSSKWQGIGYAISSGMMLSASVFGLTYQGLRRGAVGEMVVGLLAGACCYWWAAKWVGRRHWTIEHLNARDSRQAVLLVLTMFVHSIPEGIAIGVGYATGEFRFGLLLAVAIAIQNIPEGTAISLPLRAKGVSVRRCAGYAIFSSLPQPLAAVPAFLLVWLFKPLLPSALGFAGGAMIFLVCEELIPESLARCSRTATAWGLMAGFAGMLVCTAGLGL